MKALSHHLILLPLLCGRNYKWIGEGIPGELLVWVAVEDLGEESLVHTEVAQRLSLA